MGVSLVGYSMIFKTWAWAMYSWGQELGGWLGPGACVLGIRAWVVGLAPGPLVLGLGPCGLVGPQLGP